MAVLKVNSIFRTAKAGMSTRVISAYTRRVLPICRSSMKARAAYGHTRAFAAAYQFPTKAAIPESLLIYHAGTGRTVFVGSLKVTTIMIFAVTITFIAPTVYFSPEQAAWIAPAVAVCGTIPMLYVIWASTPFVAYAHIRLPLAARRSKEQLLRWAQSIPPSTELDLTTIKSYGGLRVSRMSIGELRPTKALFSIKNLVSKPAITPSKARPWWAPKPQHLFYVGNQHRKTIEAKVWEKALAQIQESQPVPK